MWRRFSDVAAEPTSSIPCPAAAGTVICFRTGICPQGTFADVARVSWNKQALLSSAEVQEEPDEDGHSFSYQGFNLPISRRCRELGLRRKTRLESGLLSLLVIPFQDERERWYLSIPRRPCSPFP